MTRLIISLLLVTSFFTAPSLRAQEPKLPEPIQALLPSIVTVTRVEPVDPSVEESARPKPLSHVGVFVDSRGYIAIPMLPCSTQPKFFVVRFANQQETMGELAAVDESLKVGVLKIARLLPVKAVSIDKSREARRDDRVLLVPSSASNELRSGRVLTTTFDLGEEGTAKLIQADVACPLSEFGSLMVSEAGEPIGLVLASRTNPQPMSISLPMKAIQPVLQAAIDKPKDVPLVRVAESSPAIDLHKPVSITLQPVSPLAKSLVETFAPRGAKVLEYEEGKRLKIEAPPLVLEELTKQLSQVLREQQKPEATTAQPTDTPADVKMPDIAGKWFVYQRGHVVRNNGVAKRPLNPAQRSTDGVHEFVFQRSADASADFVDEPGDSGASIWRIKWSEPTQRFQWKWVDDPTNDYDFTMMVQPDGKKTRVRITQTKKEGSNDGKRSEAAAAAVYFEEWSRENNLHVYGSFGGQNGQQESQEILVKETFDSLAFFSKPLGKWSHLRIPRPEFSLLLSQTIVSQELAGTKTDEAVYGCSSRTGRIAKLPIPKELRDPNKNWPVLSAASAFVELGNEVYVITAQSGEWSSPNSPAPSNNAALQPAPEPVANRSSHALPDTPAAKRLVEQLAAQESAAAAEAATIRQLQANGQAEQNRQAIAEHQRKLKNLLSTAFDLKLQLEELQVQELQSRLSRLERQIGQRKELREKIINRRAGELIEGDALKWDSTTPASTKLPGSAVGNTKKGATPEVVVILRERLALLWDDLRNGNAKPEAGLRAINELAEAEPPEAHSQHVERLQALWELVRDSNAVSKAEV